MEVAELLYFQVALEGKGFLPAVGTCPGTGIYHGQVLPTHLPCAECFELLSRDPTSLLGDASNPP